MIGRERVGSDDDDDDGDDDRNRGRKGKRQSPTYTSRGGEGEEAGIWKAWSTLANKRAE